jgi:hypothetical protein
VVDLLVLLSVGKRMRKPVHRRTVDYSSTVVRYIQVILAKLLLMLVRFSAFI